LILDGTGRDSSVKFKIVKKDVTTREFFLSLIAVVLSNTIVSLIISFPLFTSGHQADSILYFFSDLITFMSHFFSLNLVAGIIIYIPSLILPRKITLFFSVVLFFLVQAVLIVDVKIYSIYHYHINSLVWNVITTEGLTDSVVLGKGTMVTFLSLLLPVFLVEVIINIFFLHYHTKQPAAKLSILAKTSRVLLMACLSLIVIDKGMYAYAELVNNTRITKNVKLYPLYQPLTIKRFASKVLGIKVNRENNFKVSGSKSLVNYPKEKLAFDPSNDRSYNIIIIVVEGLRFDMLDREIMPNVLAFGNENRIYRNHYSGGNGSRFGIFSLIYGISGTYWHDFLAKRIPPVLIDVLMEKGYDFKILSSTSLTFPEFRKTAFLRIPDSIEDSFQERETVRKDRIITDSLINHMSSGKSQKPFFAFLFLNSSHQSYKYPPEFEKFRPVANRDDINYFKDVGKSKAFMIRNRYKNALSYEDSLIGEIIAALKDNRLLDNTVVIITGDHGEEFYENGYFGHTSSFNDYQTKTVFVLHVPGAEQSVIHKTTSHIDVVPTLMPLLGCISPEEAYSQGISLLSEEKHQYITSASWDRAALIDEEYSIQFSTDLYNIGSFDVRRRGDHSQVENTRDVVKQKKIFLLDFARKMSEFYK
jgi:membrane-anchored protein YejM (alkaline phosphatase superfamily)